MRRVAAHVGRLVRRLRKRRPGGLILVYHRVLDVPCDPQLLCVTPRHFAEHLEVLRSHWRPMRLRGFRAGLDGGEIPERAVAVTFDDGYADNLHHAKPLIERSGVPATVFVTADRDAARREFWWDELEGLFLQGGELPETLRLSLDGVTVEWPLATRGGSGTRDLGGHRGWNVLDKGHPSPRHRVYRELHRALRLLAPERQQGIMDTLARWAGRTRAPRETHRRLSSEEIVRLADGGLVEVGAHTVTHPVLSAVPVERQRSEIEDGKAALEAVLGAPVASFSYPYGNPGDFDPMTVRLVREAGFACACANLEGGVRSGTDPFLLPRFIVRDWDGARFARRLEQWRRDA